MSSRDSNTNIYHRNSIITKYCYSRQGFEKKLKVFKMFETGDIRRLIAQEWALLEAVAEALETVTISTGFNLYVVDDKYNKLHLWINGRPSSLLYDITPGSVLAAYSAYTKNLQMTSTVDRDPNYPLGIGKDSALNVLSLPVVTPNEKVLAVIDVYRDVKGGNYSEEDQLIGLTITNWLGAAYEKHFLSQKLFKENELHQTMFKILEHFFKVDRNIDNLIECTATFIKNKIDASSSRFYRFITDRQHWAYMYREVTSDKLVRSEKPIRFNNSTEVVSIVLRERQMLNLNINDLNKQYPPYTSSLRSKAIDNILLVPIIRSDFVLGVIEVTNKLNGKQFTENDEELLVNISKYYSLALHYANVLSKHKEVATQLNDGKKLLLFMLEPCEHDLNQTMNNWSHIKTKGLPENLMTFSYYPMQADEFELIEKTLVLFNYAIKDVFENDENMARFVIISKKIYRQNYYHNFEHAFNVMHFIVNVKESVESVLTELEWKAMVIAAFCHDMDHPGFTNNFLKATSHNLVDLYQESVLENHHSYVAHLLVKELNLFPKCSNEEYRFIMNEIYEIIIATDLAVYFQRSSVITGIMTGNSFSWFNPHHVKLLKSLMITTADLASIWKPVETVLYVTRNLYQEFYLQGDKEKDLGLKPISMMDRKQKKAIPTDQLNFIILICMPCADILVTLLPQLYPIFSNVMDVLRYWLDEKRKSGFASKEEEANEEARLRRLEERIISKRPQNPTPFFN